VGRLVEGLRPAKIAHFAEIARSLYPSDLLDFTASKRFTLLACLIFQEVVSTRDEIVQMFLKRMSKLRPLPLVGTGSRKRKQDF
jgi:hypothetical protein